MGLKRIVAVDRRSPPTRIRRLRASRLERLEARCMLAPAAAGNLFVSEVMYNPLPPTLAELQVNSAFVADDFEFIELKNTSNQPVELSGVRFTAGIVFNFSNTTLPAGQFIVLARNLQAFTQRYGAGVTPAGIYAGLLADGGEQLVLTSATNQVIQDFTFNDSGSWPLRPDGDGSSLEVKDFAGDYSDSDTWRASAEFLGSPGRAGAGSLGDVVFNEILSHTDLPQVDAIELYNRTAQPIDIGNWWLSDSSSNYFKYHIPVGTSLPAGGYLTFDEHQFNASGETNSNDFRLSAGGDEITLIAVDGTGRPTRFVDQAIFPAAHNGESFGLWPNGTGVLTPMITNTFGAANSVPRVGPIVMTELMYNPPDPDGAGGIDPNNREFIEFYNPTAVAQTLTNWQFTEGVTFTFPAGLSIAARQAIVVVGFDPQLPANAALLNDFRQFYGVSPSVTIVGPFVGRLDNSGENVRLSRADTDPNDPIIGLLIEDDVRYRVTAPWPVEANGLGKSLTRTSATVWGGDPQSWFAGTPSPGSAFRAPTDITLTGSTIRTNQRGAVVGPIAAIDPDVGDTHTWQVNDARFEVTGGALRLKSTEYLLPSSPSTIALQITASDSSQLSRTKAFTINVVANPFPWQNPNRKLDIDQDGLVTAKDAVLLITQLNAIGVRDLTVPRDPFGPTDKYLDPSGDNALSPLDPLLVIIQLNAVGPGEGEAPEIVTAEAPPVVVEAPTESFDAAHLAALWSIINEDFTAKPRRLA
jgi:hypothetical protein